MITELKRVLEIRVPAAPKRSRSWLLVQVSYEEVQELHEKYRHLLADRIVQKKPFVRISANMEMVSKFLTDFSPPWEHGVPTLDQFEKELSKARLALNRIRRFMRETV